MKPIYIKWRLVVVCIDLLVWGFGKLLFYLTILTLAFINLPDSVNSLTFQFNHISFFIIPTRCSLSMWHCLFNFIRFNSILFWFRVILCSFRCSGGFVSFILSCSHYVTLSFECCYMFSCLSFLFFSFIGVYLHEGYIMKIESNHESCSIIRLYEQHMRC